MPGLEELAITECQELIRLPHGWESLPDLKTVHLRDVRSGVIEKICGSEIMDQPPIKAIMLRRQEDGEAVFKCVDKICYWCFSSISEPERQMVLFPIVSTKISCYICFFILSTFIRFYSIIENVYEGRKYNHNYIHDFVFYKGVYKYIQINIYLIVNKKSIWKLNFDTFNLLWYVYKPSCKTFELQLFCIKLIYMYFFLIFFHLVNKEKLEMS